MAITFNYNFVPQNNVLSVLAGDPTGVTLRVTSGASADLGSITFSGNSSSTTSVFLKNFPTWISWRFDPKDTTNSTVILTANGAVVSNNLYNFYLMVQDGVSNSYFAVSVEVRQPFSLNANVLSPVNIKANDPLVAPIVFQGYGINNMPIQSGVQVLPASLPAGVNLYTGDGATATLMVDQPSLTNLSGGVTQSAPFSSLSSIRAFTPGTMYDTPDRVFTTGITLSSVQSILGVLKAGMSCYWDSVHGYFVFNSASQTSGGPDFVGGASKPLEYHWDTSAIASQGVLTGGGLSDTTMTWTPGTTAGPFNISLDIYLAGSPLGTGTSRVSSQTVTVYADSTWANSLRLSFDGGLYSGFAGTSKTINLSAPSDTGTTNVTFALYDYSGNQILTGVPANTTLTGSTPTAITFNIPTTPNNARSPFPLKDKYILVATGTNSVKTGKAYAVITSNGYPQLTLSGSSALSQATGSTLTPTTYSAGITAGFTVPTALTFYLQNAPPGLTISPSGVLTGSVLVPGTYSFKVYVGAANCVPALLPVTLTVTAAQLALTLTKPTTPVVLMPDNTQFNISWSYAGNPSDIILQTNTNPGVSVLASPITSTSILGTSVFSLVGKDYVGKGNVDVYTVPLVVGSQTSVQGTNLPQAPTVATIDHNSNMSLSWSPAHIGDDSIYKGWFIATQAPAGSPQQVTVNNSLPTGLESGGTLDNRSLSTTVSTGNLGFNMYAVSSDKTVYGDGTPYPSYLAFPGVLSSTTFTLDKTSANLGESVTLSMSSTYFSASSWRVVFNDDNSATDWYPLSNKLVAKAFTTPGTKTLTVEVKIDYPNQSLSLIRSTVMSLYVVDQQYTPTQPGGVGGIGSIGIGGEQGFQITEAQNGISPSESYEVIVRALVSDALTQEVKLLVATSRTDNSSSLLGTMALDVFPLLGRPHLKDIVLSPTNYDSYQPVVAPVRIKSQMSLPDVTVGKPLPEFKLETDGKGVPPYSWYSNNLPYGLKLSSDGTLSGTILTPGTFTVNFSVKDSSSPANIDETSLVMVSKSDLAINTKTIPDATVMSPYSFQMNVMGGLPPYTFSVVSGALPLGVTLNASTGILGGLPCTYNSHEDFQSPFSFTFEVSDSLGSKQSANYSMNLLPSPLSLGAVDVTHVVGGVNSTLAVPIFGGVPPYSGLSVTSDGSIPNTLRILGPLQMLAMSGVASVPLTISTPSLNVLTVNEAVGTTSYPVSLLLTATGGTANTYSWSIDPAQTNNLPGLKVSSAGVVTGTITYNSSAGSPVSQSYQIGVKVSDVTGKSSTATINIIVNVNPLAVPTNYVFKPCKILVAVPPGGPTLPMSNYVTAVPMTSLPAWVWNTPYNDGGSPAYQYGLVLWNTTTNAPAWDISVVGSISGSWTGPSVGSVGFNLTGATAATFNNAAVYAASLVFGLTVDQLQSLPILFLTGTPNVVNTANVAAGSNILSVSFSGTNGTTPQSFSGQVSVPSPGQVATTAPYIYPSSMNIVISHEIKSDGGSSYSVYSFSPITLSAVGGYGKYTWTLLSSSLPGTYIGTDANGNPIVTWNSAAVDLSTLTAGSYNCQVQVSDSSTPVLTSVPATFPITLTENVVNNVQISITSNTMPAMQQSGTALSAGVTASSPIGNVVASLGGVPLTATKVNDYNWNITGTVPRPSGSANGAEGNLPWSIQVVASADGTKTDTKTGSMHWFNKNIQVVPNPGGIKVVVGQAYKAETGNCVLQGVFTGYNSAEVAAVFASTLVTTVPALNITNIVYSTSATAGGTPVITASFDILPTSAASYVVTIGDSANSLSATGTLVVGNSMPVVGSLIIPVSVAASQNNNAIQPAVPTAASASGGTPPYTVTAVNIGTGGWFGGNSAQVQTASDISTLTWLWNIPQTTPPGTYNNIPATFSIVDSSPSPTPQVVTGYYNLTVRPPALAVAPITGTNQLQFVPGTSATYCWFSGVQVLSGTAPYTWSVSSVYASGTFLSPFSSGYVFSSPTMKMMGFNNTAAAQTMYDYTGNGFTVGTTPFSAPVTLTPPAMSAVYVATVTVTDATGQQATCESYLNFIVPTSGGGGGGGGGCVPAGTLFALLNGYTPIEKVKVGMSVRAYDELTLQPVEAVVEEVFSFEQRGMAILHTDLLDLRSSRDHRVWSKDLNAASGSHWPPVEFMSPGDRTLVEVEPGVTKEATVLSVELLDQTETVYHVRLSTGHVYVAGGVLAHNMKPIIQYQTI